MGQPDPLLAGSVGAGRHSLQLQPPHLLHEHLNPGQSHTVLPGTHSLQGGLLLSGQAVLDQPQDRVSLLLSRGQEPTAQHLLSADKRINLVTNNRAIKPFIWLAFCCQLPGKSNTQHTNKAVCSHLCHLPHSSVLACRLSQAVWCGRHQVGGRSRFGKDREVKTPGESLPGAVPRPTVGREMREVPIFQQVHAVPPFLLTELEPST